MEPLQKNNVYRKEYFKMKISELIAALEKIKSENGDLNVMYADGRIQAFLDIEQVEVDDMDNLDEKFVLISNQESF